MEDDRREQDRGDSGHAITITLCLHANRFKKISNLK